MKRLAKLIRKDEQRDFSKCLMVRNGSAFYTDSFSLIEKQNIGESFTDGIYSKKLRKLKPVNYPEVSVVTGLSPDCEAKTDGLLRELETTEYSGHTKIGIRENGNVIFTENQHICLTGIPFFEMFRIARYMSLFTDQEKKSLRAFLYPESERVGLCLVVGDYRMYFSRWRPPEIVRSFLTGRNA